MCIVIECWSRRRPAVAVAESSYFPVELRFEVGDAVESYLDEAVSLLGTNVALRGIGDAQLPG